MDDKEIIVIPGQLSAIEQSIAVLGPTTSVGANDAVMNAFFNASTENIAEHSEKYNLTHEQLKEADEKIISMSIEGKPATTKKDGKVLRKRTRKDYERLWNLFKAYQLKEFEETMKYGEKEIKKIGVKAFIDAMDWYNNGDIKKWRTDILHIMPCIHCGLHFAVYETELGLCEKCKPAYDVKRFSETCAANEMEQPGVSFGLRVAFVYDKEFRDQYRFKSLKEQIKQSIKEEFMGVNSFMLFKNAIEEKRYTSLYHVLSKHKDKMSDRAERIVATVNAALTPVIDSPETARQALVKLYFDDVVETEGTIK